MLRDNRVLNFLLRWRDDRDLLWVHAQETDRVGGGPPTHREKQKRSLLPSLHKQIHMDELNPHEVLSSVAWVPRLHSRRSVRSPRRRHSPSKASPPHLRHDMHNSISVRWYWMHILPVEHQQPCAACSC